MKFGSILLTYSGLYCFLNYSYNLLLIAPLASGFVSTTLVNFFDLKPPPSWAKSAYALRMSYLSWLTPWMISYGPAAASCCLPMPCFLAASPYGAPPARSLLLLSVLFPSVCIWTDFSMVKCCTSPCDISLCTASCRSLMVNYVSLPSSSLPSLDDSKLCNRLC